MSRITYQVASRAYSRLWSILVHWLRVPDRPPALPVRTGDTLEQFRPAQGFLRYLKFWFWLGLILFDGLILIIWIVLIVNKPRLGVFLAPVALLLAAVPDIVVYVALHVRYDTTWYVMTRHSLRIRRGVWIIQEVTITFENVQNLHIHQGPLQRHFGISNLVVETAGAGGGGHEGKGVTNQGVIEGISDPQRIRDLILSRVRQSRTAGLGDEEPVPTWRRSAWTNEHVAALQAIRDELAVWEAWSRQQQ